MKVFLQLLVDFHLNGMSIAEMRVPLEEEMDPAELTELMDLVVLEARNHKSHKEAV